MKLLGQVTPPQQQPMKKTREMGNKSAFNAEKDTVKYINKKETTRLF